MNTPTMAVAAHGRWFAVRYLPTGARHGASGTSSLDRVTVEFYDLSLADDTAGTGAPGFGPLGQYIARYDVATLLNEDRGETGLMLHLGIPEWSIDGPTLDAVRAWLRRQHKRRPIRTVTLTDHLAQYEPVTVAVENVATTLKRWGECQFVDEFQAALIAGDDEAADEMAGRLGIGYEVAGKG
jgi:hypothetical protein